MRFLKKYECEREKGIFLILFLEKLYIYDIDSIYRTVYTVYVTCIAVYMHILGVI